MLDLTIKGFDAQGWGGQFTGIFAGYSFFYGEPSVGDYWSNPNFRVQWLTCEKDNLTHGAFNFYRRQSDSANAIKRFRDILASLGDFGDLKVFADFEDTRIKPSLDLVNHMNDYILRLDDAMGYEVGIYTAPWWWDKWAKPYVQSSHVFYTRDLWVCDVPPPDAHLPGEWKDRVMQQISIGSSIDVDMANSPWMESQIGPPPINDAPGRIREEAQALKGSADALERIANELGNGQ